MRTASIFFFISFTSLTTGCLITPDDPPPSTSQPAREPDQKGAEQCAAVCSSGTTLAADVDIAPADLSSTRVRICRGETCFEGAPHVDAKSWTGLDCGMDQNVCLMTQRQSVDGKPGQHMFIQLPPPPDARATDHIIVLVVDKSGKVDRVLDKTAHYTSVPQPCTAGPACRQGSVE